MEHPFRSAAIGGFNKQDVLDFLEAQAKQTAQAQQELQGRLEESERQGESLRRELDEANRQLEAVRRALEEADQAREAILQKKSRQEYQLAQATLARALNRLRVKGGSGL